MTCSFSPFSTEEITLDIPGILLYLNSRERRSMKRKAPQKRNMTVPSNHLWELPSLKIIRSCNRTTTKTLNLEAPHLSPPPINSLRRTSRTRFTKGKRPRRPIFQKPNNHSRGVLIVDQEVELTQSSRTTNYISGQIWARLI